MGESASAFGRKLMDIEGENGIPLPLTCVTLSAFLDMANLDLGPEGPQREPTGAREPSLWAHRRSSQSCHASIVFRLMMHFSDRIILKTPRIHDR